MRIGIVGLGLRASHVVSQLKRAMPELQVSGYVDPNPGGLAYLSQAAVPERAYPDLASLLESKPDLLLVASPNHLHLEHIKQGLAAGVPIFAEKPIVVSREQTFALAKLLAEHGTGQVQVGLVLRYARHMRSLREAQDEGLLGSVVSIEANEHIAPYHGAFFMRDWRRLTKYSGGFMLEKCCHDLDMYNMIAASRPVRVASFGGRSSFVPANAPGPGDDASVYRQKASMWEAAEDAFAADGDIVDNQVAILEYASGARLAFHTNSYVPDEQRRFCVIGTEGMAEGDLVRGDLKITSARTRATLRECDFSSHADSGMHYGADELMAQDLARYLRGEIKSLPVSAVDCMVAGLTAMALDEARTSGTVVDLKPTWEKLDSFGL